MKETIKLFEYIFGDQIEEALDWFSIALKQPTQRLPIIYIAGQKVGKTTFLNYVKVLFENKAEFMNFLRTEIEWDNQYLENEFLLIDEGFCNSDYCFIRGLNASKSFEIRPKRKAHYEIEITHKFIICAQGFLRSVGLSPYVWYINHDEVRDRKLSDLSKLKDEIPDFLKFLKSRPLKSLVNLTSFKKEVLKNSILKNGLKIKEL